MRESVSWKKSKFKKTGWSGMTLFQDPKFWRKRGENAFSQFKLRGDCFLVGTPCKRNANLCGFSSPIWTSGTRIMPMTSTGAGYKDLKAGKFSCGKIELKIGLCGYVTIYVP